MIEKAEAEGKTTVRLHTGDPCIYGAIREQMDILDEKNITYDYCPGVKMCIRDSVGSAGIRIMQRIKQLPVRKHKQY